MHRLNLKTNHKAVAAYYQSLGQFGQLNIWNESAIKVAFQHLLETCAKKLDWMLVLEWEVKRQRQRSLRVDAVKLPHGYWEAKDERDDLSKEVNRKFDQGYHKDNILFQAPERAILWQNGKKVLDEDISQPQNLVGTLETFFNRPAIHRAPDRPNHHRQHSDCANCPRSA